ncbi:MAG: alpha/beta hydrolase [Tuberibacillus sp.]
MQTDLFVFQAADGTNVHVTRWMPDENPWAVVQIAHGMVEHGARYGRFAEALTAEGMAVYANDHRGHGKTAKSEDEKGHFADDNGWDIAVKDMKELTDLIKNEHRELPIILFGHSLGSFLSRRYAQMYGDNLSALILSGTGGNPGIMGSLGLMIARREVRRKGKRDKSELMNKLIFGGYNKAFKPARTPFDWLSRDEREVDKYIEDPDCGFLASTAFYADLIQGLKELDRSDKLSRMPKDLPILFISGDQDPVGGNGKGVLQVYQNFMKAGMKDVTCKLYKGGRHELLNETNRDEVTQDILRWIQEKIRPTS